MVQIDVTLQVGFFFGLEGALGAFEPFNVVFV